MGGIHRRRRAPLVHPPYRDRPPTKTAARLGTGGGARGMTNPTDPPARGCRAPSVATTGSGPLPPAARAPTSTLHPRPPHSRGLPARDQLGAPRVKDRQQDRGHLRADHAHGHVVAAHRGRDVCHLLCLHRRPRVGQQSTNLAATAPPTFAAHRRSRLGRRGRRHRPTMSGGHQRRHHTAGHRGRFPMWTVMAQRWDDGSVRD